MKLENKIFLVGIIFATATSFLVNIKTGYFSFNKALTYDWALFISTWVYDAFILLTIILFFVFEKKHKQKGIFAKCFWIMLIVAVTINLFKYTPIGEYLSRPSGYVGGFPSGHSATAFAMAFLVSVYSPRLTLFVYSIASAVAFSRIFAGTETPAHYPYQVVGGVFFGLFLVYILYTYWNKSNNFFLNKCNNREPSAISKGDSKTIVVKKEKEDSIN